MDARFDPLEEGFYANPYPQYERLRREQPVQVDAEAGIVYCFTYEPLRRLLIASTGTSMDPMELLRQRGIVPKDPPGKGSLSRSILGLDPPDHTRVRRHFSRAFTQRSLDRLMLSIERRVDELVDDLEESLGDAAGPVDLFSELAFPFPFWVISRMLGMPEADDDQVRQWANDIAAGSGALVTRGQRAALAAATVELTEYVVNEVLPWKREHLDDDLLSALVEAHDDDPEGLTADELLDNVSLLYVAGHETTSNLIANCVYNLLVHPDQRAELQADFSLLPNAVEELTRFDGSVQTCWRFIVEEFELADGVVVAPGTTVYACVGSANRDHARFGDTADSLDLARPDARELISFGGGAHFCLGAHLARRETACVLHALLTRFPDLELAEEPTWRESVTFRGPEQLMVASP